MENKGDIINRKRNENLKRIMKDIKQEAKEKVIESRLRMKLRDYWIMVKNTDISGIHGNRGVELKVIDDIWKILEKYEENDNKNN